MPELPEVETVRRTLLPLLDDCIVEVTVREDRFRERIAASVATELRGRRVVVLRRHAKYLLIDLSGGDTLLVHLGMSGTLVLQSPGSPVQKHDHVVLAFASGRELVFNDPRRFGLFKLGPASAFVELQHLGRDPLATPLSVEDWTRLLRKRRTPIKSLLLDQRWIGGIGNIYASEILFRAGIRPTRRAGSLTRLQRSRLAESTVVVLSEAVRLGGSSISDYRDATGRPGYFQIEHRVYERDGQPCRECGSSIKRVVLAGRSSFYCPRCQR